MENVIIVLKQILSMFIYIGIGFSLYKAKLITKEGSKVLGSLLLYVILPSVLIRSFAIPRTTENTLDFLVSFVVGFLTLLLAVVVSGLLYKKKPIENFSASFSNAGFMGIPLISSVLGSESVFLVTSLIAFLNVMQWTYGQYILSEKKVKSSPKELMKNPLILGFVVGLVIFSFKIPLPELVAKPIDGLAEMNAPVAMILLGVYLAQANLKALFLNKGGYWLSAVRLLFIPTLTLLLLCLLPPAYNTLKMVMLIAASAPVGSNIAVYAQKLNQDYVHSVQLVCLSTLLSLFTIPLITALGEMLWF